MKGGLSVKLPRNLLNGTYGAPDILLCETDKTKIGQLNVINMKGTFKFNSYSEISFDVPRYYVDTAQGTIEVNPLYNKVEALRLVYLGNDFGYFEIQEPSITGDGIKEIKQVTAYSLEYTLSQRYLREFVIRMGYDWSIEDVVFYNDADHEHSLLHLALRKAYGWSVGHVDAILKDKYASFEIDKVAIYDFFVNELSEKFNCMFVFDTINNTVNAYAESMSEVFHGDGHKKSFTLSVPYVEVGYITITDTNGLAGSFRTTDYTYDSATGTVTFTTPPAAGTTIEIVDGYQSAWDTDVYVSFENLSKEMTISYNADNIKTVLYGKGADDLEFREVNLGLPYVIDLSYYHTVDWMGQELYDMYGDYLQLVDTCRAQSVSNITRINEIINQKIELENRISAQYALVHVTPSTIGTYYTRSGGYPNYIYTEVTLPEDYEAGVKYYKLNGVNLTEEKIHDFQEALGQELFRIGGAQPVESSDDEDVDPIVFDSDIIREEFEFVEPYTIVEFIEDIKTIITDPAHVEDNYATLEQYTNTFLEQVWEEYGINELTAVEKSKKTVDAMSDEDVNPAAEPITSFSYCAYRANYIMLHSVSAAKELRQQQYDVLAEEQTRLEEANTEIGQDIDVEYYFTTHTFTDPDTGEEVSGEVLLPRLSAFMREDEYLNDSILVTDAHTDDDVYKLKEELKQNTLVELSNLCKPRLSFSMSMANIYSLSEFAPLMNQFQLGNLIRVALRPDYVKRTRIMQVQIQFDDMSKLSCEFGDLTNVKSPSDIHADLLSKAIQAGKTVSSNKSYWNKGSTQANVIDSNIQSGLLDSIESIKSLDGTQGVEIDKYGIHLRKQNEDGYDPKQVWMVNNQILFTDDNFKTAKTVLGEFKYGDRTLYGLLADGVVGGLVAGSDIEGGTIKIGERADGEYNFYVDENGVVTIQGGEGVAGEINNLSSQVADVLDTQSVAITPHPSSVYFKCDADGEFVDTDTSKKVSFTVTKSGVQQNYTIRSFDNVTGYTIQKEGNNLDITPASSTAADEATMGVTLVVDGKAYVTSITLCKRYDGEDGEPGLPGTNGYNHATINLYKRSTSPVSVDWDSALTYTFSTNTLSPVPSGWATSVPSGINPLYMTSATAYNNADTDTIEVNEWSAPIMLVKNGDDGRNVATVFLYQRAEEVPSVPSSDVIYTFSTGAVTGDLGDWSSTIPEVDTTNILPCYIIQATASAIGGTDTIYSSEWSTPVLFIEDEQKKVVVSPDAPDAPYDSLIWVDTSASPSVMRIYHGGIWEMVQAEDSTNNTIFINTPNTNINGFLYHTGDMWVITDGSQVKRYVGQVGSRVDTGTYYPNDIVLICINNKAWVDGQDNVVDPADWSDIGEICEAIDALDEYRQSIKIFDDGLYMFAADKTSRKTQFYSRLTAGELAFYEYKDPQAIPATQEEIGGEDDARRGTKVVWIGNESLHAVQADVEGKLNVVNSEGQTPATQQLYLQIGNFRWQTEADGSFSLVKISQE